MYIFVKIGMLIDFVVYFMQMTALKSANKELKGMMKTVKIQDIDVSNLFLCLLPFIFMLATVKVYLT